MAQQALARRKKEEKIQSGLFNLELDEPQTHGYHLTHYPDFFQQKIHKKQSDCPELSDWTSNVISNQLKNNRTEEKDPRRLSFLNSTRYPSSLLSPQNSKKNSRLELSPIVVKFNANVLSQNLIRSREKYIKKLKEDPYLTHYQSSNLLQPKRESLSLIKRPKRVEVGHVKIKFEGSPSVELQRPMGIVQLLKREVPFRSRPRKPSNPELFSMTRMF